MTRPQLAALARGLAPVLRDFFAEVLARVEAKERGLDGKDGARGPEGPEGKPGRDGRDGLSGVQGEKGLDGIHGKDGSDGLGFDDLVIVHDGDRRVTFRFIQGDRIKETTVRFNTVLYRGVYEEGRAYEQGDSVTFGGSQWIAREDTTEKPGDAARPRHEGAWQLSVKVGRDGKEGKPGKDGSNGRDGKDGVRSAFQ